MIRGFLIALVLASLTAVGYVMYKPPAPKACECQKCECTPDNHCGCQANPND